MKQVKPVLGENLEDLHCELECPRPARQAAAGAGKKTNTVGTSINCSAICERRRSRSTRVLSSEILGTSMTCSGNTESRRLNISNSWFPRPQHKSTENLHERTDVSHLLHGVPQNALLWPPRLTQTGWPGTAGLLLKQLEELRTPGCS